MKTLVTALFCLAVLFAQAQSPVAPDSHTPPAPDLQKFVLDCMKSTGQLPHRQLVLWIPSRFWEVIGQQMNIPADNVATIVREMDHYVMVCVVDYNLDGPQMSFRSADEIRSSLKLVDSSKKVYLPLAEKDISPMAMRLINQFQPMMAKFLGQFGDGMRWFMFDGTGAGGKPAFDVTKSNRFLITWDNAMIKYTLPLASALPPKSCPVDNEPMQGNWSYCPFHGVKLP